MTMKLYEKEILPFSRSQEVVIPKPKLALVENMNRSLLINRFVSCIKDTYITVQLLSLTQEAEILCRDLESGNNVTIRLQVISPKKVLQVFPGETDKAKFPIKFKMPKFDNSTELDKVICDHIVNQVDRVIWISGAAGCGKSVLVDRIIERLNSGMFNQEQQYGYKKVYAVKLSAEDYNDSSDYLLEKKLAYKIKAEYSIFEEKYQKCDGSCGFVVVFDELDFVGDIDIVPTILRTAIKYLGDMIGAVVFVDVLQLSMRLDRIKQIQDILGKNGMKLMINAREFSVPNVLSYNQFNTVLNEFPLSEQIKRDLTNKIKTQLLGQPLLSMYLLRKVLVDLYYGRDVNINEYLDNLDSAVGYILERKAIERVDNKKELSWPRFTNEYMQFLCNIARMECVHVGNNNDHIVKLMKYLGVLGECKHGFGIKSPIIRRFLRNKRM